MQPMEATSGNIAERKRVEAIVETFTSLDNHGETLGELAHDARNMVTALSLYCDLLEEPGVLSARHRHYGNELRLVADASRRLVEKLTLLDERPGSFRPVPGRRFSEPAVNGASSGMRSAGLDAPGRINDLRLELEANRNLLAAMAGPFRLTLIGRGERSPSTSIAKTSPGCWSTWSRTPPSRSAVRAHPHRVGGVPRFPRNDAVPDACGRG